MKPATRFVSMNLMPLRKLPPSLSLEIGKAITRYAHIEYQLNCIIYILMGVPHHVGRLTVREPTAKERVDIIVDLIKLNRPVYTIKTNLGQISKLVQKVSEKRNQLAHGCWAREPNSGKTLLWITNSTRSLAPKVRIKRKILPEGIFYGVKECREFVKILDFLIKDIDVLEEDIKKQRKAWLKKRGKQSRT